MIKHDKVKVKTESVDMEDIIIPRPYLQRNRLSDKLLEKPWCHLLGKAPFVSFTGKTHSLSFDCVTDWQQTALTFEALKWKIL